MKRLMHKALLPLGLILLSATTLLAQTTSQSLDDKIKQAKEEAQKLEAFVKDPSTSASLRASLQPILDNRNATIKDLEALSKLPVKLSDKELGVVVRQLENATVGGSTAGTVAVAPPTTNPCPGPACGSTSGSGNAGNSGSGSGNAGGSGSGNGNAGNSGNGSGSTSRLICGGLRPASMDQTLTMIQALPSFRSYTDAWAAQKKAEGASADSPEAKFASHAQAEAKKWAESYGNEDWSYVAILWERVLNAKFSTDTDCSLNPRAGRPGEQKKAVVDLLHWLLTKRILKPTDPYYKVSQEELKDALGSETRKFSADVVRRQIDLLNGYIGNVKVVAKDKDDNLVGNALSDQDGQFIIPIKGGSDAAATTPAPYVVSTEGDNNYSTRDIAFFADCNCYKLNIAIEDRPVSLLARAVIGYQQAGSAATDTEQNYFFDLFISKTLPLPFKQNVNPDFGERARLWGAIRAISVPQSGDFTLSQAGTTLATNIPQLKAREAARVFDYLGGLEYRIAGNSSLLPSFDRQTRQKFSLSLIGGFGFVTPSSPTENVPVFQIPPNVGTNSVLQKVLDDNKIPKGTQYIAFPRDDRDRFFRQYYGGIRVQTFFFNNYNVPLQRFPAQFDLTVGQNEYVTGGRFDGPVVRFDGYFPLPYNKLQFINLFGTAVINPTKTTVSTPLILTQATDVQFTDARVYLLPVSQANRDYYRVGFGFDLVSFLKMVTKAKMDAPKN